MHMIQEKVDKTCGKVYLGDKNVHKDFCLNCICHGGLFINLSNN